MLTIRKSLERGQANHGWLTSFHTFSFADYFDPKHMGFRSLRVINEDYIDAAKGFPMHPHRDMEIITYVVEGCLEHKDSSGVHSIIKPGEVQRMSAGTGIAHSEFNPSANQRVHLLQIWILPNKLGIPFSYDQKSFAKALEDEPYVLAASADGREGSIQIQQNMNLYVAKLKSGARVDIPLKIDQGGWVQVVRGDLRVNTIALKTGDALAIEKEDSLFFEALADSEFLVFDL